MWTALRWQSRSEASPSWLVRLYEPLVILPFLPRHQADPGGEIAARAEDRMIGNGGDDRAGEQRADAGYLHQRAAELSFARARHDPAVVLENLLLHDPQLGCQHLQADPRIEGEPAYRPDRR